MAGNKSSELPPGFRFHPTDEELIMYYLRNQATSRACPAAIIPEVDIYKFDPWELPEKTEMKEKEWYFFTPRDRKYPNGVRPNRAAVSGYWKATGTDKSIYSGSKYVGIKKALVFYKGRPPKGTKTDWIMHEYRLSDSRSQTPTISQSGSMRLDDWVLCRIYKKKNHGKALEIKVEENQRVENVGGNLVINEQQAQQQQQQAFKIARQCSLSHLWESEYMESMSLIFPDNSYNTTNYEHQNNNNMVGYYNNINNGNGNNNNIVTTPRHQGEVTNQSSSLLSQQQPVVYMNHDFNFQ